LDTRVNIELGKRKGKIVIEFATIEDLERINTEIQKNK
jgi:ParB family chromosome partitioning protein